jgi:hypothetical protein
LGEVTVSALTRVVVAGWLLGTAFTVQSAAHQNDAVNQDSRVIEDFSKRVDDYAALRKRAQAGLPVPKQGSAAHIRQHQKSLGYKIRTERLQAMQGDVFNPAISALLKKLMAATFESSRGSEIRASLRHAEPVRGLSLKVNQAYPPALALQSTPPTLLLDLPRLPPDIEYRIVGRELILLDTAANLIVDLLPDALPASPSER